jgi:hypothetical protein
MTPQLATGSATPFFAPIRQPMATVIAGALWATCLAALVVPVPAWVTEGEVVVAAAATLPEISKALRLPLLVCAALLGVLTFASGQVAPLLAGLDFAAPLAGFLVSISVLRAAVTGGARGALSRARFDALSPPGKRSAVLLLSFALSAVFLVGVFPLLAPLATERDDQLRAKLAAAALCGAALALLWSPFGVGMAFTTASLGIATGPGSTLLLLTAALFGLAIALVLHGRLEAASLKQAGSVVRPLVIPLGLAVAMTLAAAAVLPLRVTQVVPLVTPLVVLLLGLQGGVGRMLSSGPVRDAAKAIPECGGSLKDLTVFAVGFALARAMTDTGVFSTVAQGVVSLQVGAFIPALLVLLTIVLGLLGVPAMVCAGLVIAGSALPMAGEPVIERLLLALYAWSCASVLSVTSGTLTVVASSFDVPLRPLVFGRTLLFVTLFGALVAAFTAIAL